MLYDLVNWTQAPLPVRWDAAQGFHVPDLVVQPCPSIDDMFLVRLNSVPAVLQPMTVICIAPKQEAS